MRRLLRSELVFVFLLMTFILCVSQSLTVHFLREDVHDRAARAREQRTERIAENDAQKVGFCIDIEDLKAKFREDAVEDYNDLNRNLRLLGIKRTPEIERIALANLNEARTRFAPESCALGKLEDRQ